MNNCHVKPFLRWAGSKKKLLPELSTYWNDKYRYIEPFAGSARLFFHLKPQNAILGDLNSDLINCYQAIKTDPSKLYSLVTSISIDKNTYYKVRGESPINLNQFEQAARFIYLNRLCFNGLYRTNNKGEFNVPYSGVKISNFPTKLDFENIAELLKNTEIINSDFEQLVINNLKYNDFIYLDPPYTVKNKRIFKQYGAREFGYSDIKRLYELLN